MSNRTPPAAELLTRPDVGVVVKTITPTQRGRVQYQATSWPACLYGVTTSITVEPDQPVKILGRRGLTLLIQPLALEKEGELPLP
ncbi:NfeD family protein [Halomicronema sp. CCY15110]|uniref:NfeD family protein n=1 Tax=Halomicronema sp. CCY15110 TaxID=2767773 RepID=UPI0035CCEFE2